MRRTIPGLSGSQTHLLGVAIYRAHHDGGDGFCVQCGRRDPCPGRRHAAEVILAAGDDPRRHDRPANPAQFIVEGVHRLAS